jgi:hypothetical protein
MNISNLNFTLTGFAEIPIVEIMRWKALIVLLAVLIGVVVPPSLPLLTAAGAEASLGTLDVCHKASPALFSHGEMPCMNECPCQPLPLASISVPAVSASVFRPLLLPFQDERPPQS